MKKLGLLLIVLMLGITLSACQPVNTDYSVDEAFGLMNDAIQNYLEAESFMATFQGSYESESYNSSDLIEVRFRNIGKSNFLGRVELLISENSTSYQGLQFYQAGVLYNQKIDSSNTERVKFVEGPEKYLSLYTSYLKKQVDQSKTRAVTILIDSKQVTVNFELSSSEVEATFFVSNVFTTVRSAKASITFTHDLKLVSMNVEYIALIQGMEGIERYQVDFSRFNQYVTIKELSNAEKAIFILREVSEANE